MPDPTVPECIDRASALILAAAATGFGLRGASVTQPGKFAPLFKEHQGANIGTLWDVHIDDLIPSRAYRRVHYGEA